MRGKKKGIWIFALLLLCTCTACANRNLRGDNDGNGSRGEDKPLVREDKPLAREEDGAPKDNDGGVPKELETEEIGSLLEEAFGGSDVKGFMDGMAGYDAGAGLSNQVDSLNKNNLTPEMIAAIEADAEAEGYEVQWAEDGSMVIVEDGSVISMSSDWPDNEFTALVPAPKNVSVIACEATEDGCTIAVSWDLEAAKEYASLAQQAGFTEDVEETDMMGMYVFSGTNADGITIGVSYMSNIGGIDYYK